MNCQICGSIMKEIPAGVSKKTGKPYSSFMSCPNRCKSSVNNTKPENDFKFENFVADEFAGLSIEISKVNERLNKMAEFLQEKLEKKSG